MPRGSATSTARGARRCGRRRHCAPACRAARRPTGTEISAENRAQGLTHFCCRSGGPWCASKPANGLRLPTDRPRAATAAIARPKGAAAPRPKTWGNVLSHNQCYTYGMTVATGRRPFSTLGDQQLLDQTRRLAGNQRSLEVHVLDHLDEIDRRSLALRRGFSSLFDYAVRELRFSDAAAQRRIQTMRLCRRHGWVRAMLHSGDLSLTAAAQMETAFATAERRSRRASATVGLEQCHDQSGLPASPSATGATGDRDAEELGAGAGVAGAAVMTVSAAHGRGGRRPGGAVGGRCRRAVNTDIPGATAARPIFGPAGGRRFPAGSGGCAAGGPTGVESRHRGRCPRRRCLGMPSAGRKTSAPERGVENLRGGESREAGSKHVPDVSERPDSNAATLHAPQQAAPRRAPRTGLAGEGSAEASVVRAAEHAPDRSAALPDGRQAHHVAAVVARAASHAAVRHRDSPACRCAAGTDGGEWSGRALSGALPALPVPPRPFSDQRLGCTSSAADESRDAGTVAGCRRSSGAVAHRRYARTGAVPG